MATESKVTCKEREKWCFEHSAYMKAKNWEYYCLMNDSFIQGVTIHRDKLKEHLAKEYNTNPGELYVSVNWVVELLDKFGEDPVEYYGDAHGVGSNAKELKHGQPVQYYLDNKLTNGFWDYIEQKNVPIRDDLSGLTAHHKTYVPVWAG